MQAGISFSLPCCCHWKTSAARTTHPGMTNPRQINIKCSWSALLVFLSAPFTYRDEKRGTLKISLPSYISVNHGVQQFQNRILAQTYICVTKIEKILYVALFRTQTVLTLSENNMYLDSFNPIKFIFLLFTYLFISHLSVLLWDLQRRGRRTCWKADKS